MRTVGLIYEQKSEKHVCPVCGKEYKTEEGLLNHMADKHPDAKKEGGSEDAD